MEGGTAASRKVMVVADPSRESAVALQWALSHAVVDHDELILLHVENGLSWKSSLSTFLKRSGSQVATIASRSTSFSVSPLSSSSSSLSSSSSSSPSSFSSAEGVGDMDFLETMKRACEAVQPKARVRVERVDIGTQDKAATILFQSAALSVDLLVIGQRRSLSTALLGYKKLMETIQAAKCNIIEGDKIVIPLQRVGVQSLLLIFFNAYAIQLQLLSQQ